jgi:hypothetical protein
MIEQVKELRIKIDDLAQLTKELNPINPKDNNGKFLHSKEIEKAVNSLYLAKAWLGNVLDELGAENPYKSGYKTVEDIEPTADVAKSYRYRVTLSNAAWKKHDGNVLIYFDENPRIIDNIEFEFYSTKKLTKNEVKDKIKGTSYVLDITGDFLTLEEDVNNNLLWLDKKSHIEKVDWLRTEIKKLIENCYKLCEKIPETRFYSEHSFKHLSEARFWLGFELKRIKNNG